MNKREREQLYLNRVGLFEQYRKGARVVDLARSPTVPIGPSQIRKVFARMEEWIMRYTSYSRIEDVPVPLTAEVARTAIRQYFARL